MNPNFRKVYHQLCNQAYDLIHFPWNHEPLKSLTFYTGYAWHLLRVYSPRLSHFELYTDAYTPARTKYNAYIVYGLIGGYFAYEFSCLRKEEAAALKHRLEHRP